jgi:hypothetical protein
MNHLLSVPTFTIGLALSASAIAQSPPAGLPAIPVRTGSVQVPLPGSPDAQLPIVTQSSRIRAFNVAPNGEVDSLYLQNGSVVDVTSNTRASSAYS